MKIKSTSIKRCHTFRGFYLMRETVKHSLFINVIKKVVIVL